MRTRMLAPTWDNVETVIAALRRGALVAFPTDTVYGLGALANHEEAVTRIFQVKGRGAGKPIAVLLADAEDLPLVAREIPEAARRLAARFWPGALTLVLPSRDSVVAVARAGSPNVGVRLPDHPVARDLIRRLGAPLATTSANRSGQGSLRFADEVWLELNGQIEYIIEGECPGGVESTVVDLSVAPPAVLRAGAITLAQIEAALAGLG